MQRSESPPTPLGPGSPACPDLLCHVGTPHSVSYQSFFEEECRRIVSQLRAGAAPSPQPVDDSSLWLDPAGLVTSTPQHTSQLLHERAPDSARPVARPNTDADTKLMLAAKSTLQHPSEALQLAQPAAAAKLGATAKPAAAPKPAAAAKLSPRDTEMKTAGEVVGRRQPTQRFSARIPPVASHFRLPSPRKVPSPRRFCSGSRPIPGKGRKGAACARAQRKESEVQTSSGSTTQELICNTTRELICNTTRELICNTTRELTENNESKEQLVAAGTLLGAGRADQMWKSVGPSFFSELVFGLTPGCGDAVTAEQSAGDQLSDEMERIKGELAVKTAQCEAYRRTISSLQAQLRAAGICPEGAAVEESGDSGRD